MKCYAGIIFAVVVALASIAQAGDADLQGSARDLNSDNAKRVEQAEKSLRAAGPAGLTAALEVYDKSPNENIAASIDAVAAQRGATISRLYWYTDLEQAKAAARAQHRAILYLRLLGKLTDEYSCANSRFFRTVLYANADVSTFLREHYVLVWVSERPVPVITIDFGDGRTIKRTITGNSIHYILNADGKVIDALPGLFGPRAFLSIARAESVAVASMDQPRIVAQYLDGISQGLLNDWRGDSWAMMPQAGGPHAMTARGPAANTPPAAAAMKRAVSKSAVESPMLAQMAPHFAEEVAQSIDKADAALWEKVAERHLKDAQLDAASRMVMLRQNPELGDTVAFNQMVDRFQHLIALDTVHNNYQLRRQIIAWLRQSPGRMDVETLNQRVYAELFLTPRSDPWLGLAGNEYCALGENGCFTASK